MGTNERKAPSPFPSSPAHARRRDIAVCDALPVACLILDGRGRIRDLNATAVRLLRRPRSELLASSFQSFVRPADRKAFARHLRSVRTRGRQKVVELALIRPAAEPVPVQLVSVPDSGHGARPRRHLTVIHDITRHQRVREALRRSEARYRTLAEAACDMIFIIGADDRVQYVNQCAARGFGCRPEALIGQPRAALFPPATGRHQIRNLRAVMKHGLPRYVEDQTPFPGGPHWLGTWLVPLKDDAGRVTAVMGVSRVITPVKQIEQALKSLNRDLERQVAERTAELSRREHEFHTLADNVPGLFAYIGADLRYRYVNRYYEAIFGRPATRIIGRRVREVVGRAVYALSLPHMRKALGGAQVAYEAEFQLPAGVHTLEVTYVPDAGPDGKVQGFFSLVHDVTARRQAERALRESREDLNRAQGVAHIGSWRWDIRPNEIHWSEETCRIFGVRRGTKAAPETFLALVHPDDRGRVRAAWQAALHGAPYDIEHRIVVKGRVKWVRELAQMEFGPRNRLRGGFGTVQDITAHKQAEEALRQSEERFRLAAAATHDAIYDCDLINGTVWWNETYARRFGRPTDTAGSWQWWIGRIHPEDRKRVLASLYDVRDGKGAQWTAEYRFQRADGDWAFVLDRAHIARDARGRAVRLLGAILDLTDRKRAEAALRESEAKYRRLVEGLKEEYLFYQHDANGRFTYVSPSVTDMLGFAPDEFQFHYTETLTSAPLNQEAIRRTEQSIRGHRQPPYEVEARHKDGSTRRLEVSEAPLLDAQGRVVAVEGIAHDVTARRAAETQLRLQSAALEAAANGMVLTDRNGVITWVNPAFCQMTGYAAGEVLGRRPSLLKSGRHEAGFYRDLWATILRGEVWHGEVINRRKDGSLYFEEMTITPVPDGRGGIGQFIAIKQDVTARRAAEEALRESQQRYRAIFSLAPSGVVLVEPEQGRIAEFNEQACTVLGYSREEFARLSIPDIEATEQRTEVEQHLRRIMELGRDGFETRLRGKDGHEVHIVVTACSVQIEGRPHVLAVWNDITARKQVEEALRQSEERFRLMVTTVSDYAIYLIDVEGRVVSWNAGAERITGYQSREILGRPVSTFHPPEELARRRPPQELERARAEGHTEVEQWRVRQDGSRFWASVTTTALRDERGQLRGFAQIIRDLTDRRRLEAAVAAVAEAEKKRIAGDLHDGLGQQLSGLGFLVEGLRRDLAAQPGVARRVGEICRLLEDTAAQTRVLVHGLYAVPPTPDGLLIALGNLAARVRRESRRQCQFRCDTAVLIEDAATATHLYRIAQEAVHNALKHSRASRIHLGLRVVKQSLELVVRDNGVGLPRKVTNGLGLQSMRHRATQVGAELAVRNTRHGAEVVCQVPLAVLRVALKS